MASIQDAVCHRRTLIGLVVTVILLSLLRLNTETSFFVDKLYNRPMPVHEVPSRLDPSGTWRGKTAKSTKPTLDIVISMFKEDLNQTNILLQELRSLDAMQGLDITTFVYTKDGEADIELIRRMLNTTHVSILRNVGREAGTYFTHILNEFDNLARHTLFIQAEMHSLFAAKQHIEDYFVPTTGVLPLGQMESCDCVACKDVWDEGRTFPRIEELYSALNGVFCPKTIALSYLGQMIVSATRLRSRGPSTYKYLKQTLESDMDHFIHSDPRQDMFNDEASNPYFGHTIERSYLVLWDCADESIIKRCGGWDGFTKRRTSDMPDDYCQCVDTP